MQTFVMSTQRRIISTVLYAALFLALVPAVAKAQGSIGFTTTTTTINAGQPFSSMDRFKDWVSPHPTTTVGMDVYAQPNTAPRDIRIESWRTGSALRLTLTIHDGSRNQATSNPPNQPLAVGDTIIIQLDPNNAKSSALQTDDKRFEIVIKSNQIDTAFTGRRDASGTLWGLSLTPFGTTPTVNPNGGPGGESYVVEVTIAWNDINSAGTPLSADFGIAIAVLNDLGHGHQSVNGPVWDLTGVAFPSSVGLAANSDPLVSSSQEGGGWLQPARWGTGYWGNAPGTITFSHDPSYYWSDAIRIGVCTSPTFGSVAPSPIWGNQTTLNNWYQYYPGNPCKMKVWIQIFNNTGNTVPGRFLVVWGRSNIGSTTDWFVAGLSQQIGITSPSFTSYVLWEDPPPVTFTDHPCLKVYLLPATLSLPWDETAIKGIKTNQNLLDMQAHYQVQGYDLQGEGWQSAQMNFTAWEYSGNCQTTGCTSLTALLDRQWIAEHGPSDIDAPEQPPLDRRVSDIKPVRRTRPYYLITALGFGLAESKPGTTKQPLHTYLTNVGGIAWAVPLDFLASTGQMTFKVDVGNPAVLAAAQPKSKLREIRSPTQSMMLVTQATYIGRLSIWDRILFRRPPPLPAVAIEGRLRTLGPGESVPIVITVRPKR